MAGFKAMDLHRRIHVRDRSMCFLKLLDLEKQGLCKPCRLLHWRPIAPLQADCSKLSLINRVLFVCWVCRQAAGP